MPLSRPIVGVSLACRRFQRAPSPGVMLVSRKRVTQAADRTEQLELNARSRSDGGLRQPNIVRRRPILKAGEMMDRAAFEPVLARSSIQYNSPAS